MSGAAAAERGGRPGLVADLFVSQEERISQFNYLLFFETLSRYEGGREEGGAPCRASVARELGVTFSSPKRKVPRLLADPALSSLGAARAEPSSSL